MKVILFFNQILILVIMYKNVLFAQGATMEADTILKHGRSSTSQKSRGSFLGKAFLLIFAVAICVSSCSLTTEQLAKQVQTNMIEHFQKEYDMILTVKVPLMLVHKGGNDYRGVVTFSYDDETEQVTVNVTYDGKVFVWEVEE
jgi:Mn2+/Fe2+ NRAMP family transporter